MPTTITGIPGAALVAACSIAIDGEIAQESDQAVTAQALANDIATIKSGSYGTTATVTHQGAETYELTGYLWLKSRSIRRAATTLPHSATLNAASFVDMATANEFRYDATAPSPNANHLKIREGTSTLVSGIIVGDWIRFVTDPAVSAGHAYTIFRENGTTALAELWGAGQWVELAWDGSKFRYVNSSPWVPNGTAIPNNAAYYGDGSTGTNGVVLYPANL